MIVVTEILPCEGDSESFLALVARHYLRGVILQNRNFIRHGMVPDLYTSKVRFRPEPRKWPYERFDNALRVVKRGWGDCDDLCPWRAAEIQERGPHTTKCLNELGSDPKCPCWRRADCKIYWRPRREHTDFHVEVRKQDGSVEDPSRLLGM